MKITVLVFALILLALVKLCSGKDGKWLDLGEILAPNNLVKIGLVILVIGLVLG